VNQISVLVLSVLLLTGCARTNDSDEGVLTSINIIDRNGFSETISSTDRLTDYDGVDFLSDQPYQKVLRVYSRDVMGDVRAYITSYHPNGQPKQYLEVVNGRAFGSYQEWYPSGQMKLEVTVVGGEADLNTCAEKSWLFDGLSRVWDEDGNVKAEIPYLKGVLDGVSLYYHCNGSVWKRSPFCNGNMEGDFEVYLENGELLQRTAYSGGFKNGPSTRSWPGGAIASEELYSQDLLLTGRYLDRNGKVVAQIENGNGQRAVFGKDNVSELQEYHQGIPEGVLSVFGKNQILIREYHLKDAVKNGEEIEYYNSPKPSSKPQPKLSVNWYQGVIQGLVRTWYPNGVLESQREMSCNKKNGISTAWYRDGSLMLIEEYDHDKIVRGEYYKMGEKYPVSQVVLGKGIATMYDADGNFLRKTTYVNGKPGEVLPD
jgi:antitoxin component YwqK of YwqJK toxin-antitoxin module